MSFNFSDIAAALQGGGEIAPEHVLAARRWAWSDGGISPEEAETIFALNHLARDPAPEWCDFFVEAMTEYVVNRQPPRGYVSDENADWLIARIDHDGRVDTMAELELIVKVVEAAHGTPTRLRDYALRQIEQAVLTGAGPTRRGGAIAPGKIDPAEVQLLRRLIFAPGGDGAIAVTRAEAEMLWRLKDATLGADNAPDWPRLFVQAVGNHLMAWQDRAPLERAEVARLEAFVADRTSGGGVAGFFGRMARAGGSGMDALREEQAAEARTSAASHDQAVAAARAVTPDEAEWLRGRIGADGRRDPIEESLLAFVEEESGWRP
jgi:hypothetical protein